MTKTRAQQVAAAAADVETRTSVPIWRPRFPRILFLSPQKVSTGKAVRSRRKCDGPKRSWILCPHGRQRIGWGVKVGRLGLCTWQRNEQWYPRRRESIPVITSEKRDVTKSFALTFPTDLPPRNFPSFFSFGVEDDGNISRNYSGTGKWVTTHTALVYGELFAKAIRHKERGGRSNSIVLHLTEAGWKVNGTRALYTRQSCMVALSRPTYKES